MKGERAIAKTMQDYSIRNFPQGGFEKILETWFEVIHDYEVKSGGDAIYWYNERANVGAFAAAMARNNMTVIEEYACLKGRGKNTSKGRADISFYYNNLWYLAEAKTHWPYLPRSKSIDTEKYIESALSDVKKTHQQDKSAMPFGLVFIIPRIKPIYKDQIKELLTAYIEQLTNNVECDFWAYCAPGRHRELQTTHPSMLFFPAVIVMGKKLK